MSSFLANGSETKATEPVGPPIERVHVLVVEDDHGLCGVMVETLEFLGFSHIHTAHDGAAALQQVINHRPDFIICDIDMEPVCGLKFLAKLRALKDCNLANTPLVFLTGNTQETTVLRAKELGTDGFLAKPPRAATIKTAINRCLGTVIY
ncbi:MAG: response regulator [Pseudomonadota bacterium]